MNMLRKVGFWCFSAALWAAIIVAVGAFGRAIQVLWCIGYQCG